MHHCTTRAQHGEHPVRATRPRLPRGTNRSPRPVKRARRSGFRIRHRLLATGNIPAASPRRRQPTPAAPFRPAAVLRRADLDLTRNSTLLPQGSSNRWPTINGIYGRCSSTPRSTPRSCGWPPSGVNDDNTVLTFTTRDGVSWSMALSPPTTSPTPSTSSSKTTRFPATAAGHGAVPQSVEATDFDRRVYVQAALRSVSTTSARSSHPSSAGRRHGPSPTRSRSAPAVHQRRPLRAAGVGTAPQRELLAGGQAVLQASASPPTNNERSISPPSTARTTAGNFIPDIENTFVARDRSTSTTGSQPPAPSMLYLNTTVAPFDNPMSARRSAWASIDQIV